MKRKLRGIAAFALSASLWGATLSVASPVAGDTSIDYLTASFRQERILDWGERPDWSSDGRKIVFTKDDLLDGPAYEIDVQTRKVRCLTCQLGKNQFVSRIFYLPDDSFLIEASPGMAEGSGGGAGAMKTELFWMPKSLSKPVPLGVGAMGDIAIAATANPDKSVNIAWAKPKESGLDLVMGKLTHDGRTAQLVDVHEIYSYPSAQSAEASFPEAYEFIDGGRSVMFWTVEMRTLNGEMYKVDIQTKAVSKVYAAPAHNETHVFPDERFGLEESNAASDPAGPYRGVSGLSRGAVGTFLQMKGVTNAKELAATNSDKGFDIYVVTMDGASRRQLTNVSPSGAQAHQSVVSPDGKQIAFAIKASKTGQSPTPPGLYIGTFEEVARSPAADAFTLIPEKPSSVFFDATYTHVPIEPSLHAMDSVFIDVDHDGDLDVVVAVEYGVNRVYLNDGKGRLTEKPGAFGTVIHDNEHVRAADFNGDGNMDVVFVAESDEVHQLFLGDGKGGFTDASARLPASCQGNALSVGDVNGDGLPDIVVGCTGEQGYGPKMKLVPAHNLLFLNNPKRPGYFIDATATHLPKTDDQTEGVALADMDGDGDLDMVLASPSRSNRLLLNDGKGHFTDASDRLDLRVPLESREVHVFDANGDGHNDIVFFNITSNNAGWDKDPQTRLLINDGKGKFRDETAERLPSHRFSSWAGTVVDFNHDGAPDLLVGAIQVPGFVPLQLQAWQNDGKGHFKDVTAEVIPGATVGRSWSMGQGDLDGDGKPDVFIGGWGTQARLLLTDLKGYAASFRNFRELKPANRNTTQ